MQRKDIGKRLADGVSAKLEFDYTCERGNSFSEYYLHGAINEIVAALVSPTDFRIHAGYPHKALARGLDDGPGRQREVDFLIQPYNTEMSALCIEAKWAGSSHCRWDRILLDICRLALVKEHSPTTECLFVLSGPVSEVEATLKSLRKNIPARKGKHNGIRLLEEPGENRYSVRRVYRMKDWAGRFVGNALVENALPKKANGKVNIPAKVATSLVRSHVTQAKNWQTIVWRVSTSAALR